MTKPILLLFITLLNLIPTKGYAEPIFMKNLIANERVHDFGTIMEIKGKVSYTFVLTNKDKSPVAITNVNAWCGCTTSEYSKAPIMPGKTGKVTVTFDPNSRPGKFSKEVVVMLNDGKAYMRLWVKGNVVPYLHPVTEDHPYYFGEGLYMSMKVLPFANQGIGVAQRFVLRLANNTKKPMKVCLQKKPFNKVLKIPAEITLKPLERKEVKVSYAYPKHYSYDRYIWLDIKVNGKKVKPMKVRFFGDKNVLHMK